MGTINTTVTVSPGTTLATLTPQSFGINLASWDSDMMSPVTTTVLAKTPLTLLRFPGGSTSDFYHWAGATYKNADGSINTNADPTQHTATGQTTPNANGNSAQFPAQPQFPMGIQYTIKDFMDKVVKPLGTASQVQIIFTANYGSNLLGTAGGDPTEAASFAYYMNKTYPGYLYGIEIGNEIYGSIGMYTNGGWEFNTRPMSQRTPTQYAADFPVWRTAIRTAVPGTRVAPVLTAPGNWPDQTTSGPGGTGNSGNYTLTGNPATWNQIVLSSAGSIMDFTAIHVYPQGPLYSGPGATPDGNGGESDPALLACTYAATKYSPSVPVMAGTDPSNGSGNMGMKQLMAQYCASNPLGAANVPWFVTETNSVSYNPGKQTVSPVDALWLVDWFTSWIENGCAGVLWWAFRNGNSDQAGGQYPNLGAPTTAGAQTIYGPNVDYGDFGIVAYPNAPTPSDYPPAGTLNPAAFGFEVLRSFAKSGDRLVRVSTDQTLCRAHGAVGADGTLRVLVSGTDPANSFAAALNLGGFAVSPNASGVSYGGSPTASTITTLSGTVSGGTLAVTIQPYTAYVYTFQPSGTPVPPSGGGTSASVTLTSTTMSPQSVNPGGTMTFTEMISTDTNVTNVSVRGTIIAPDSSQVALTPVTTNLNANVPTSVQLSWAIPVSQTPGVGYKLTVAVYASGSTTPYMSQDTGQTFTVSLPQTKAQPLSSPGSSILVPDGIPIPGLTDPAIADTLVQAAVTVNSPDSNKTHVAPLIAVTGTDGIAMTPNRESTQIALYNALATGLMTIQTARPFVWLYGLDPVGGTVRLATGDTRWQPTAGLEWVALKIVTLALNAQNGSFSLQYFLDIKLANGDFETLWQSSPYSSQILTNSPQTDRSYVGPPLEAGTQGLSGSLIRALPLTDFARIRWVLTAQSGTTNLTSTSAISFWGE